MVLKHHSTLATVEGFANVSPFLLAAVFYLTVYIVPMYNVIMYI